jgi:hypothetical protein
MIAPPRPGAYVAPWKDGHPPEDIMDWLRCAGVSPHTRIFQMVRNSAPQNGTRSVSRQVEVHFDNEMDAFMCWMAFSDDLVEQPRKVAP